MQDTRREKRQFGRRRTTIHAFILTDNGVRHHCLIRNISGGGALLEVDHSFRLPAYFKLIVAADGFEADCEVRHRSEHAVGIFFLEIRIDRRGSDSRCVGIQPVSAPTDMPVADLMSRVKTQTERARALRPPGTNCST